MLIFKLESAKLFDSMVNDMNNRIASILTRGQIPEMQQQQEVREAAPEERTQRQQYTEQKAEINDPAQQAAAQHDTRENIEENHTPLVKDKLQDATTRVLAVAARSSRTATARVLSKEHRRLWHPCHSHTPTR